MLKDDSGCWIGGFAVNIKIASNIAAELWAIIHGLDLAWEKGVKKVII